MSSRPNVVVVVLDTARADAFEPYGAPAGATPTIADVARRGTALPQVFSTCNWTMPSHASMFTGLMPRTLGLGQAPDGRADLCRPRLDAHRARLLPAVLQQAGYRTCGVSANLWITRASGFDIGFDRFVEVSTGRNAKVHEGSWRTKLDWYVEAVRARVDDGAGEAAAVIDTWLADDDGRPFFYFVNLIECHSPYLPPGPWTTCNPWQRVLAARDARRWLTLLGVWGVSAGVDEVPAPALARMRAQYAASVRQLDDWIERLLDRLDRAGKLDDTVVIITSDHGENLGESGRLGHSFWLDDRLVRVPLVTMGPAALPSRAVTSLADVPSLIAHAVGLDEAPWPDLSRDPIAVAQSDALTTIDDPRINDLRATYGFDDFAIWRVTTSSTCATDGSVKLVREGDEDWLYDLATDPAEERPVLVDGRVTAAYAGRLEPLLRALDAQHVTGTRTAAAMPVGPPPDVPAELQDRMRLLGYL